MDIVLVRHGSRYEDEGGLSDHGRHEARTLGRALRLRGSVADCWFSSASAHALETARLLQEDLGAHDQPVHLLKCLTPRGGPGDAGGLAEFVAGRGQLYFRYPTFDHQEEQLRSKVQSKMTVATFLAGFVFTALSGLLLLVTDRWTLAQVVAVVALAASLALFVACVYIYDQLGMPSGFWTDSARPRLWRRHYARRERAREQRWHDIAGTAGPDAADEDLRPLRQDGPRYHLMISTSRLLFTPATWLALAGFLALLTDTGDWRMLVGGCAGLLLAGVFALTRRPDLGAD